MRLIRNNHLENLLFLFLCILLFLFIYDSFIKYQSILLGIVNYVVIRDNVSIFEF